MARWTLDQVEKLAPDESSVKAARKLALPRPWSDTGSTDTLVWGKCQGSGSTPYQVSVDLTGPAFKCSCPSRKFPCKHGLALLMLWVANDGSVVDATEAAGFASDWQAARGDHASGTSRRSGGDDAPADPEARAKRLAQRLDRMDAGIEEFERWLDDLVREGLAAARQRSYDYWDAAAARLVDAQLPGLAERVRATPGELYRRDDWADHLLAQIGRWYCATRAFRRRDSLQPVQLGDVRAFLGWAVGSEDLRDAPRVTDTWQVLGVLRTDDGRLQAQRTWLRGQTTGDVVVVLDFAAVGGMLRVAHLSGSLVEAELVLYPGGAPHRAQFTGEPVVLERHDRLDDTTDLAGALDRHAIALADNPLVGRLPATLEAVAIAPHGTSGRVVDAAGSALPLDSGCDLWSLLALTGGRPIDMFVEIDEGEVRPLSLAVDGRLVAV